MQNINSGGMTFYGGTFTGDTFNGDTFNGGTFNGNAIGTDTSGGLATADSTQIASLIASLTTLVADLTKLVAAGTSQDTSTGCGCPSSSGSGSGAGVYDTGTWQQASSAHHASQIDRMFHHMM